MRTLRNVFAAAAVAAWALSATPTATAASAGATLSVSVRVVPSCAVQARPVDEGLAAIRLSCSSGHPSNIQIGDALTGPRSVHLAETTAGAVRGNTRVTVNF